MGKRRYDFSLVNIGAESARIDAAGGYVWAVEAGTQMWVENFDLEGETSNGYDAIALNHGAARFSVDDDVLSIDVFGIAPTGHSFAAFGISGGFANLGVDLGSYVGQSLVIPFNARNTDKWTIGSNTGSGIIPPVGLAYDRRLVRVLEADAGETIDVGQSNDPDGLIDGASLAAVGTLINATVTTTVSSGTASNREIDVNISAGSNTGRGYVVIGYDIVGPVS